MERTAKQVIVLRKDLNMRKGKMVAQGSHASLGCILKNKRYDREGNIIIEMETDSPLYSWLNLKFTKVTVSVDSEDELIEMYDKAISAGLTAVLITDAGLTEFNGVPTKTAVGIGPHWPEDIDKITGHLKLL